MICVAFLAAAILLPEENGMAEAIIRRDDMPDSAYIVNRFDYPAIVAINNCAPCTFNTLHVLDYMILPSLCAYPVPCGLSQSISLHQISATAKMARTSA